VESTALLTDRYELTMLDAAIRSGVASRRAVFEMFARALPPGRRYGVVAGVGRAIEAIDAFRFDAEILNFLLGERIIDDDTAGWLDGWRFDGHLDAYREGECYFPGSPVLTVEASFGSAVVLETLLLSILNFDSAIASAASRMVGAAEGRPVIEMGTRRTEEQAGVASARAAYVAGFASTSNLEAGRRYGIPTAGTASHAFVLAHASEREAFAAQMKVMGVGTTLLVDTFDVESALRTAVELARELGATGPGAIRLDSGDLVGEAARARALLDELGATETRIVITSDLDEYAIAALAKAPVDAYGVGTRVVTGSGAPTSGFVYKLVAIASEAGDDAPLRPVEKRSPDKHSLGARKHAVRLIDEEGQARVEYVRPEGQSAEPWTVDDAELPEGWDVRELQLRFIEAGDVTSGPTDLEAAREHHRWAVRELGPAAFDLRPGGPLIATRYGGRRPARTSKRSSGSREEHRRGQMGDVVRAEDRFRGAAEAAEAAASESSRAESARSESGSATPGEGSDRRSRALLVVDVQRDFCEGGSLGVQGGEEVSRRIAELVRESRPSYAAVLASRDWHVNPGTHFAQPGEPPDFVHSWPVHCVAGSDGAELHPLVAEVSFDAVFDKGVDEAAYSAFEGRHASGASLTEWLLDRGIEHLDVCGIATDYCVRATVLDAVQLGFGVRVLVGLTAGVSADTTKQALAVMAETDAVLVGTEVAGGLLDESFVSDDS
jgi:putative nicotinate phosphoribosyltransferase